MKIKIWTDRRASRGTPHACAVAAPLNRLYGTDEVRWAVCHGGIVWQRIGEVNVEWRIAGLGRFVPWLYDTRLAPPWWRITLVRLDWQDRDLTPARIRGRMTLAA